MPIETVFMVGHAQLPQSVAARTMYETFALAVEFEPRHGVILKVSCTLATEVGREFVTRLFVGRSLGDPIDEVIQEIRATYHGAVQNALSAAARDLWRDYAAWRVSDRAG